PACRGLDRERPAELVPEPPHRVGRRHRLGRARDDRHSRGLHRLPRGGLRAHRLDRLRGRTDPDEAGRLDGPCEGGILGEEPVAGMDRLGIGACGDVENPLGGEVALCGGPRADQVRLVGDPRVERIPVGLRVDGGERVFPGWMVAAMVAREFLVSGLRLAALERGVVLHARDLGKLKTWAQAVAAAVGGFAAAGTWSDRAAWWALLIALILTWLSGIDYARVAPSVLRGRAVA